MLDIAYLLLQQLIIKMASTSRKAIAKSVKTLLVLLQSLRDQQVTITLRNDTIVKGTIIRVDSSMNIELSNATVEADPFYCTEPKPKESEILQAQPAETTIEVDVNDDDFNVNNTGDHGHAVYSIIGNRRANENDLSLQDGDDVGDESSDSDNDQSISKPCDYFIVKGSRIRHIDLPTDNDLLAGTKSEIERIRNRRKQWSKGDIVRTAHAFVEQLAVAAREY